MANMGLGGLSFRARLGIIAAVALAVRVVYVMAWSRHATLGFDASSYYELAKGIASHGRFTTSGEHPRPTALFPPGFPFFLAIGRWLGFGTRTKLLVWCAGLGTVTVVLIGLLGRRVFNARVGLWAAVMAAVYPNLWLADGALMTETLTAALIVSALLMVLRLRDQPRVTVALALGALLLWMSLTRSDGVFVTLLCCVAVVAVSRFTPICGDARSQRIAGVAILILPVLGVGLWQVRTQHAMHAFVPIAVNSWAVVAGANCESTYFGDRIGTWELPCVKTVEAFTDHGLTGEIAQNRYARDRGSQYARKHLGRLPVVAAARLGRAFGAYDPWRELEVEATFEGRSLLWSRAGFIMYLGLIPLAALGIVSARRGGRKNLWVLAIPAVSVVVSIVIGYGNQRFRMPLEPVLVVLAAAGVQSWCAKRPSSTSQPAGEPS